MNIIPMFKELEETSMLSSNIKEFLKSGFLEMKITRSKMKNIQYEIYSDTKQ